MNIESNRDSWLFEKSKKILSSALDEVIPENLIKKNVSLRKGNLIVRKKAFSLASYHNVYLVAFGKAAPSMSEPLLDILGNRVNGGVVAVPPTQSISLDRVTCLPVSHPLPEENSARAAREILSLARKAGEKDLLLVFISGGGSAMASLPLPGVSLEEKRQIVESLLKAGADISELNTVRKHLSRIKGGRLAQAAYPATIINLVISDVRNNNLENIASGPTYWDSSTFNDALRILEKYKVWNSAPPSVREVIKKGMRGEIEETVKKESQIFKNVFTFIIGDNTAALQAARKKAQKLGFKSWILTSSDQGEAREAARIYTSLLVNILQSKKVPSQPLCLLAGGELTVTVKGKGKGGRNQEFVMAALMEMEKRIKALKDWLILSLGTDGIDGPTDAAGAWGDASTLERAKSMGLDPKKFLNNNDSYNFFNKVGGLITTGPTCTNVMDIRLILISE